MNFIHVPDVALELDRQLVRTAAGADKGQHTLQESDKSAVEAAWNRHSGWLQRLQVVG